MNCEADYVGESERTLKTRLNEHDDKNRTSVVGEHSRKYEHTRDYENPKVLGQASDWFERGVKEAIEINRTSSSLNADKGRHTLPPVYQNIIVESRDT